MVVDDHGPPTGAAIDGAEAGSMAALLRGTAREAEGWSHTPPSEWWIVFRFHSAVEVLGRDRVRAVRVAGSSGGPDVSAGMLLRAIGCRGLPFDEAAGTVPHERDRARGLPGTYVVGRIERGLGWHRGRGRHGDAGASGRSTAYTVTA